MTALQEYDRLEAVGLWRAAPEAQRREVIVSLGEATLTLTDTAGRVLAHWSLAAIRRSDAATDGAVLYFPDGDPGETLELARDETAMIDAIERVRRVLDRRQPRPGRLRLMLGLGLAAVLAAAFAIWLPGALHRYALATLPEAKRAEIGAALLSEMTRLAGPACSAPGTAAPLDRLALRVLGEGHGFRIVVLRQTPPSVLLPGGIVVLGRQLFEAHEDPDVAAGYLLAEAVRHDGELALSAALDRMGGWGVLRLLTTGDLPRSALEAEARGALTTAPDPVEPARLLAAFERAELRSTPYAFARDPQGQSTQLLIRGDPRAEAGSRRVLSDADWVRLQGVCDG